MTYFFVALAILGAWVLAGFLAANFVMVIAFFRYLFGYQDTIPTWWDSDEEFRDMLVLISMGPMAFGVILYVIYVEFIYPRFKKTVPDETD